MLRPFRACCLIAIYLSPVALGAQHPDPSLVVTTDWLAQHLTDPSVIVLDVDHDHADYARAHIPGAKYVDYTGITRDVDGRVFEMLDADSLSRMLGNLGITSNTHVIVTAPMLPMATRMLAALEYGGVEHVSLLDGGAAKWTAEHRPLTDAAPVIRAVEVHVAPRSRMIARADWVRAQLNKPGISFIDTRTDPEYNGSGERHGTMSRGHLPGARQLEWEQLTTGGDELQLKSLADLQKLYAERVHPGDTVVTYCAIGYRASATYFVARYLGYPAKLYDGSYQEWSALDYPTDTTRVALRRY
jgi:thiosulfate/3-mercaptopyruvate sulfurtransferase